MTVSIPIQIDLSELEKEFSFSEEQSNQFLQSVVSSVAAEFANQLQNEAQQNLKSTRNRYLRAIQTFSEAPGHASVVLSLKDPLVAMIEEGASSFDMKTGFLASPKVKTDKKGNKYLTIPFRWAASGSVGESEVFSFKMPEEIHTIVKKKTFTIPVVGGGIKTASLTVDEIPKQYQVQTKRQNIPGFDAYFHKGNIYEGISKYKDETTDQNVYKSFRRVSENSDQSAFIHPGIKAYNLFQNALNGMDINMENNLERTVDTVLSQMGFS